MKKNIIFIAVLLMSHFVYAQNNSCRVLLPDISGKYTGTCKKGLAHGKGLAEGINTYEGEFSKGLPDGRGKYTWADNTYYEGNFKKGLKEGKGKMVYNDSVKEGYWREDNYIGKEFVPPYVVIRAENIARSSIVKTPGELDQVRIRFLQSGNDTRDISDLSIASGSGHQFKDGHVYGIQYILYPVDIKIRYLSWNMLRSAQYYVTFDFTINDPGSWNVTITGN